MELARAVEPDLRLDAVERPQRLLSSTMISPPPKVDVRRAASTAARGEDQAAGMVRPSATPKPGSKRRAGDQPHRRRRHQRARDADRRGGDRIAEIDAEGVAGEEARHHQAERQEARQAEVDAQRAAALDQPRAARPASPRRAVRIAAIGSRSKWPSITLVTGRLAPQLAPTNSMAAKAPTRWRLSRIHRLPWARPRGGAISRRDGVFAPTAS